MSARILLVLLALLLGGGGRAWALESAPVTSPRATATLVSDTDALEPGKPFRVALRLAMAPGWHTYWRNPGEAGIAPELDFALPPGLTASPVAWPAPSRHAEGPLMTYGYAGDLLLAATISGSAVSAGPTAIELTANWLVCATICVPEQGRFRLELPRGASSPSAQAKLFAAADARIPVASPWPAAISPEGVLAVRAPELAGKAVQQASFVPDAPGLLVDSAPQMLRSTPDGLSLALRPGADFHAGNKLSGVLLLRDGAGQDSALALTAEPGPAAAGGGIAGLLGLAFLGGLILNLMPCVFPVLAMKAIGLAALAGQKRGVALRHAGAYAMGVLATFCLIGAVLLALRQAGAAAGWGFQFQSPAFVLGMAWVLFAVGLNLSGVFAIGGPVGAGQHLAGRGGLAGSFFTGLLAVLVATPCTAPFMGAAIAGGLAGSAATTMAVFAAMGLGLAAPYVLLAAIPAATRALPRPGRWMELLRQILAFPMYAACAWLVWVLSQQAGSSGVLAASTGLILLGFSGWALGLAQSGAAGPGFGRMVARTGAALGVFAAIAVLANLAAAPPTLAAQLAEPGIEAYSAARLAAAQAEGRPVFVNMTASWCVTCLVNERVALASGAVRSAFADRGVVYLKGDWTRQDPEITRFLRDHGRDGVPLYVLFPGHGQVPEVLPQVLTPGLVLDALAG